MKHKADFRAMYTAGATLSLADDDLFFDAVLYSRLSALEVLAPFVKIVKTFSVFIQFNTKSAR